MKKENLKWTIFAVTAVGNFLTMLDSSTVNVALYRISTSLNASITEVEWVILSYMLVLTVFLPIFGKLGDFIPRKILYACGFLIFALGSFLNTTATSLSTLIIYRSIEALGGSIIISNSSAIISSIFKDAKRGKALGIVGGIIALGGMTGPAIGGILINSFGWQSIFLPNIPIGIIGAFMSYKLIPSFKRKKKFDFDYLGFICFSVSMFSFLLAISKGHTWGWQSTKIISLFSLSILFGISFVFAEKKSKYPIINFDMFNNKAFTRGNIALFTSYLALFTNGILFPFYAQEILNYSPLITGLLIFPFSFALIISAPISGDIAGKIGSKLLTVIGPLLMAAGLSFFIFFNEETTILQIILAQIVIGIGNGMFQPSSNTAIMNCASKKELGIASGILALFRNTGMIVAVALTITLFDSSRSSLLTSGITYKHAFLHSYHITLFIGVILALICSAMAYSAYKGEENGSN